MIQGLVTEFSVTRAREDEAPACLALLPQAIGTPAELLIARRYGEFAGAAALIWTSWSEPAGFNVLVRVLNHARSRGVGRALVGAAADLADGETDGLWSFEAMPLDSLTAKFFEACGFVLRKREHHLQVDVTPLLRNIAPIAERFRARMPEGAEVLYLSEAPGSLDEIAWLVAREFNSNPLVNIQSLRRRIEDGNDGSILARWKGEVAGVLLWRAQHDEAIVDARVVSQRWRSSWPNLLMMEKALLRGQSEGLQRIRFYCDETNNDTKSLARRGGGEEIDRRARYYLAFH
jgi:GNAT superfamily N-acetyltransferase